MIAGDVIQIVRSVDSCFAPGEMVHNVQQVAIVLVRASPRTEFRSIAEANWIPISPTNAPDFAQLDLRMYTHAWWIAFTTW